MQSFKADATLAHAQHATESWELWWQRYSYLPVLANQNDAEASSHLAVLWTMTVDVVGQWNQDDLSISTGGTTSLHCTSTYSHLSVYSSPVR